MKRELKGINRPGICVLCGRALDPTLMVWLTLDQRTNTYTDEELVPEEWNQGGFEFGEKCAERMRREHRAAKIK